jgi:hypothetical protein
MGILSDEKTTGTYQQGSYKLLFSFVRLALLITTCLIISSPILVCNVTVTARNAVELCPVSLNAHMLMSDVTVTACNAVELCPVSLNAHMLMSDAT